MEITLYELFGLIKDGQGPDDFIYNNIYWYKGKNDKNNYYACNGKMQFIYFKIGELNNKVKLLNQREEKI